MYQEISGNESGRKNGGTFMEEVCEPGDGFLPDLWRADNPDGLDQLLGNEKSGDGLSVGDNRFLGDGSAVCLCHKQAVCLQQLGSSSGQGVEGIFFFRDLPDGNRAVYTGRNDRHGQWVENFA